MNLFLFLFLFYQVRANLEKIIFTASPSLPVLQSDVSVSDDLFPGQYLEQNVLLGFHPNNSAILIERWYFIHSLYLNYTYEIRLSWPATVDFNTNILFCFLFLSRQHLFILMSFKFPIRLFNQLIHH